VTAFEGTMSRYEGPISRCNGPMFWDD
jgi:hypothetical protein